MTSTTPEPQTLSKYEAEMLEAALAKVEGLRAERQATVERIDGEVRERLDSLANLFGHSVEYQNAEGRTIKFRMGTAKRTSYVKVVKEVKENASKPMREFIDRSIEANTSTHKRKTLKATTPKKGRPASVDAKTAGNIRKSYARTTDLKKTAAKYGVSLTVAKAVVQRKGAYKG